MCLFIVCGWITRIFPCKWHTQCSTLIFLLTCPLDNYVASFTCRQCIFWLPKKNHQLALLAVSLNFQYLCLLTLMPSINPKRDFMVFFSSSCTSQGKSRSHDVWYFRSRLLFSAKTSGWDSAFLLSPGSLSFVEFNCCVAWMSSLLVTVSSDFRVKPKRNKLMVAYQAAIFVCLVVHGKYVRGLSTNLPMNTCSWRKTWRKTKYSMYRRKDLSLYLFFIQQKVYFKLNIAYKACARN